MKKIYIATPIHFGGVARVFKSEAAALSFYETPASCAYNSAEVFEGDRAKRFESLVKTAKEAFIRDPVQWAAHRMKFEKN